MGYPSATGWSSGGPTDVVNVQVKIWPNNTLVRGERAWPCSGTPRRRAGTGHRRSVRRQDPPAKSPARTRWNGSHGGGIESLQYSLLPPCSLGFLRVLVGPAEPPPRQRPGSPHGPGDSRPVGRPVRRGSGNPSPGPSAASLSARPYVARALPHRRRSPAGSGCRRNPFCRRPRGRAPLGPDRRRSAASLVGARRP